jgi:hypothetical protein
VVSDSNNTLDRMTRNAVAFRFQAGRTWHSSSSGSLALGVVSRAAAILDLLSPALTQSGCAIRCGPVHTVPAQKVHLIAPSPSDYSVRVITGEAEHTHTPVPANGRVSFDVPIGSRYCTPYLFGVIKVGSPTPVGERRVIRVMRGERVVRKLSASDIARLPADTEGYRMLRVER